MTTTQAQICVDCTMILANGDPGDVSESEKSRLDTAWAEFEASGCTMTGPDCAGGDESECTEFSKRPCDLCRSPLAGQRHRATIWS